MAEKLSTLLWSLSVVLLAPCFNSLLLQQFRHHLYVLISFLSFVSFIWFSFYSRDRTECVLCVNFSLTIMFLDFWSSWESLSSFAISRVFWSDVSLFSCLRLPKNKKFKARNTSPWKPVTILHNNPWTLNANIIFESINVSPSFTNLEVTGRE